MICAVKKKKRQLWGEGKGAGPRAVVRKSGPPLRAQTRCQPQGLSYYHSAGAGRRRDRDSHQVRDGITRRNISKARSLPLYPLKNLRRPIQKEVKGKKQVSWKSFGEKTSLTTLKTSFSALSGGGGDGRNHNLYEPSFRPI